MSKTEAATTGSRLEPRCNLPTEILDFIFKHLSRSELLKVLVVSSGFHQIAAHNLYHHISLSSSRSGSDLSTTQCFTAEDEEPLPIRRSILFLKSLLSNSSNSLLVRNLEVEWPCNDQTVQLPTANLYRLLRDVLYSMKNLKSLSIHLEIGSHKMLGPSGARPSEWPACNPYTTLEGCTFRLTTFSTGSQCDASLTRFLESQPNITDLTLRAYSANDSESHGLLSPVATLPMQEAPADPTRPRFNLAPTALPHLRHLRAIHASPYILSTFLRDRPVEGVSIPLYPRSSRHPSQIPDPWQLNNYPSSLCSSSWDSFHPSLSALSLSSSPIKRITIFSFDPTPAPPFPEPLQSLSSFASSASPPEIQAVNPVLKKSIVEHLFEQLSECTPELEALHVVVLMARCSLANLESAAPLLSRFKHLKYITFMASGESHQTLLDLWTSTVGTETEASQAARAIVRAEQRIATVWHAACPTLRTIILPRGRVWFNRSNEVGASGKEQGWSCMED